MKPTKKGNQYFDYNKQNILKKSTQNSIIPTEEDRIPPEIINSKRLIHTKKEIKKICYSHKPKSPNFFFFARNIWINLHQ